MYKRFFVVYPFRKSLRNFTKEIATTSRKTNKKSIYIDFYALPSSAGQVLRLCPYLRHLPHRLPRIFGDVLALARSSTGLVTGSICSIGLASTTGSTRLGMVDTYCSDWSGNALQGSTRTERWHGYIIIPASHRFRLWNRGEWLTLLTTRNGFTFCVAQSNSTQCSDRLRIARPCKPLSYCSPSRHYMIGPFRFILSRIFFRASLMNVWQFSGLWMDSELSRRLFNIRRLLRFFALSQRRLLLLSRGTDTCSSCFSSAVSSTNTPIGSAGGLLEISLPSRHDAKLKAC